MKKNCYFYGDEDINEQEEDNSFHCERGYADCELRGYCNGDC